MADPFPSPRRTRILRVLFAVSLALNLAVIGIAAGLTLRGQDGRPPRDFALSLGPVARALAPEDRTAIRDALQARADLGPRRRDRAEDLARLIAALTADPYDATALRTALTAPAASVARVQAAAAQALADRIDTMTPDARKALADRLSQNARR